jgi:hypothetical protein
MRGMVRMSRARGWAVAAAAAGTVLVVAGCGGGGGDDKPATSAPPSSTTQPATTAPAMSLEDAFTEYQQTMGPGCSTVEDCQTLMTARLAAVDDMRAAMVAADPARYAVPIAEAERADRVAQQYGADNLGAAGNMQAVMQPIQAVVSWYASNR